jgi:DNA-binding transcriptional LysR family regulator
MGPGNRPLDLDWLEDFLALAESGNFSRAAQARNIAQPAFSRHIKSLEEWVGVDLFDRGSHPVTLTEAGKRFQPAIEESIERLLTSRQKARAAHEQANASLRFAATHALSLTFFPSWLGQLETQLHIGTIEMVSDSFQACEELMLQRKVQFLLCHGHEAVRTRLDEAQCQFAVVGEDELVPVSAPASAGGPARYQIGAEHAENLPVLAYSRQSGLGQIMRGIMGAKLEREPFNIVFTADHAVLLKTMVLEGRGIAWLPQNLIRDEVASGRLMVAATDSWRVPIQVRLCRHASAMSSLAESLWRVVCPAPTNHA